VGKPDQLKGNHMSNLTAADVRFIVKALKPMIDENPKVDDLAARLVLSKLEPVYQRQVEDIKARVADLKSLLAATGPFVVTSIAINGVDLYVPQSTADLGEMAAVVQTRIEGELAAMEKFLGEGDTPAAADQASKV
jgi:hypothetical protein